jgi:hypothetical protein
MRSLAGVLRSAGGRPWLHDVATACKLGWILLGSRYLCNSSLYSEHTKFTMGFTDVVGLIHLTTVLSILIFCTQNMDWSAVTLEAVGDSRLSAISPLMLGIIRLICGSIVWGTLLFIALSGTPVFMVVLLRDGNKRLVSLIGPQRYAMYTVWSWTIQVQYLTLVARCWLILISSATICVGLFLCMRCLLQLRATFRQSWKPGGGIPTFATGGDTTHYSHSL